MRCSSMLRRKSLHAPKPNRPTVSPTSSTAVRPKAAKKRRYPRSMPPCINPSPIALARSAAAKNTGKIRSTAASAIRAPAVACLPFARAANPATTPKNHRKRRNAPPVHPKPAPKITQKWIAAQQRGLEPEGPEDGGKGGEDQGGVDEGQQEDPRRAARGHAVGQEAADHGPQRRGVEPVVLVERRVLRAERLAEERHVGLERLPPLGGESILHGPAGLEETADVHHVAGAEVPRLDGLEAIRVHLRLGPQHGRVQVAVAQLAEVLRAEVVVGDVVVVHPRLLAVEGEEVQVGDGAERGEAAERAQVAGAVAEPADAGLPQDQDQRRRGGDEEVQVLHVREGPCRGRAGPGGPRGPSRPGSRGGPRSGTGGPCAPRNSRAGGRPAAGSGRARGTLSPVKRAVVGLLGRGDGGGGDRPVSAGPVAALRARAVRMAGRGKAGGGAPVSAARWRRSISPRTRPAVRSIASCGRATTRTPPPLRGPPWPSSSGWPSASSSWPTARWGWPPCTPSTVR